MEDDKTEETAAADAGAGEETAAPAAEPEKEAGDEAASEDEGEPARIQPAAEKNILRDPRTGEPLRDQTVPAKDTGYLGNHDMQDKTEKLGIPQAPPEGDFGDDNK